VDSLRTSAQRAWELGFLPSVPGSLEGLLELGPLQIVQSEPASTRSMGR
jgi:hypothetical protein